MLNQNRFYFLISMALLYLMPTHCISQRAIDTLEFSINKDVYILFDSEVTNVSTGTPEFTFEKFDNMLAVKANSDKIPITTLMVRTKNNVYIWMTRYNFNPRRIMVDMRTNNITTEVLSNEPQLTDNKGSNANSVTREENKVVKTKESSSKNSVLQKRNIDGNRDSNISTPEIDKKISKILQANQQFESIAEVDKGLLFSLQNLFVDRQYLYLKVVLQNKSSISFDIDFLSFERILKKSFKRSEANAGTLIPYVLHESVFSVKPGTSEAIVYVFDLFAFSDKDTIEVKITERNGSRSLKFELSGELILKAKTLE